MTTLKLLKHLNDVYYKAVQETKDMEFYEYRNYLIKKDLCLGICFYLDCRFNIKSAIDLYWIKRNLDYPKAYLCKQSFYGREYLIQRYEIINKEYKLRKKYWIFARFFNK